MIVRQKAVFLAGILAACSDATAPTFPADAIPLDMPPQYVLWWEMTERCAARQGDLSLVDWYFVPGVESLWILGKEYHGVWWPNGNRVVIAEGALDRGRLVRHEMLHVLLGVPGHPRHAFGESCAGIVSCDRECHTEIGGSPEVPDDAPVIGPEDLELTSILERDVLSRTEYDGWFAVTVSATNPSAEAVRVRLARLEEGHLAAALFGYEVDGWIRENMTTFDEFLKLGPFETRRFTFDLEIDDGVSMRLTDGPHTLRMFMNTATIQSHALMVTP